MANERGATRVDLTDDPARIDDTTVLLSVCLTDGNRDLIVDVRAEFVWCIYNRHYDVNLRTGAIRGLYVDDIEAVPERLTVDVETERKLLAHESTLEQWARACFERRAA